MKGGIEESTSVQHTRTRPANPRKGPAFLTVLTGEHVGTVFELHEGESTIGRKEGQDVQLIDDGISRSHAKIIREADGSAKIVDLDSTNGTYINGRRIHAEGLREGDRIRVGQSAILDFRYQYRDSSMLVSENADDGRTHGVPMAIEHAISQEIPPDAFADSQDDGEDEELDSDGNLASGHADPITAYRRTLQVREIKFGKDHPAVASILDSLGAALQEAGELKEALESHQRALAIYQGRARPPRETGHVMANVGRCELALGDGESALRSFEQAHAMLRGRGASSVELARVRFSMAKALSNLGRDHDRMLDLARLSRDAFAAGGPSTRTAYDEVVSWLRAHNEG